MQPIIQILSSDYDERIHVVNFNGNICLMTFEAFDIYYNNLLN